MTSHIFSDGNNIAMYVKGSSGVAAAGFSKQALFFIQSGTYAAEVFMADGKGIIQNGVITGCAQGFQRCLATNSATGRGIEMTFNTAQIKNPVFFQLDTDNIVCSVIDC